MNHTKDKQEFFNQLFEKGVHKHTTSKDHKFVDVGLNVKDKALEAFFNKQYQKYKKGNKSDFISECIFWAWRSIERFEIKDGGTWEGILDGTDQHNINRLKANIKVTVRAEVIRFVNKNVKYTTTRQNGEIENLAIKLQPASLDTILIDSFNEETLGDTLAEEANYWTNSKADYQYTHFIQWFQENKDDILLNSQIKLLENLEGLQKVEGYTKDDIEEKTGIPSYSVATRLKRIDERVLKSWLKENPLGEKSFRQIEKEKELHMWHELIYIVEDDSDLVNQNQAITNWVVDNFDNTKLADMVYIHSETVEESRSITKMVNKVTGGKLPQKTIYKLVGNAYKRVEELSGMDFTPSKVRGVTKEAKQQKRSAVQEVYVFDSKGNLLRVEANVQEPQSKTRIVELTPSGLLNEIV